MTPIIPRITLILVAVSLIAPGSARAETEPTTTKWTSGSGSWTEATHWSQGLPNAQKGVEIQGDGTVTVPQGTYPVANLYVGLHLL